MSRKEIEFRSGFPPISIEVMTVERVGCHWHEALEVVWVLSGEIALKESNMPYNLKPGDVYVVNYNETHKISAVDGSATVAFLHFDFHYFAKYIPNLPEISYEHYCFSNNLDVNESLAKCHEFIKKLYPLLLRNKPEKQLIEKIEPLAHSFIQHLVDTFQYTYYKKSGDTYRAAIDKTANLSQDQLRRLHQLTHYIYMNSSNKLTLDDVADTVFYSKFYVSHFIKKAYGLSFQETLCLSRVTISERLLIGTDFTMDNIAAMIGFSTRNQYCQQFKKWHGITPSQFRKENSPGNPVNTDLMIPCDDSQIKKEMLR